jgi:hypothetical protein
MREIEASHHQKQAGDELVTGSFGIEHGGLDFAAALAWTAVGIPIAIGLWITFNKAVVLFH